MTSVRRLGRVDRVTISCGPPVGLREIVQQTQLTVEGTVALVESSLSSNEDYGYTDVLIDVIRLLRLPSQTATRATPDPTVASPFVASPTPTRPLLATTLRVRLRMPHQGRVVLDEGVVTETARYPTLKVGQHVIVSAYFNQYVKAWSPFGFLEVRDGRVVRLEPDLRIHDYDSVEAFAAALANPSPTVVR